MAKGPKALSPPRMSNKRRGMEYPEDRRNRQKRTPWRQRNPHDARFRCRRKMPKRFSRSASEGLFFVQARIEFVHHRRPFSIPMELLPEESRLGFAPERCIHQLHILRQRVGGKEALDFLMRGWQAQLLEQGGQVLIG